MIGNHVTDGSATRPDPRKVLARGLYQLSPHCQRGRPEGGRPRARTPGGEMPATQSSEGVGGAVFRRDRQRTAGGKKARSGASLPFAPRGLLPKHRLPNFFQPTTLRGTEMKIIRHPNPPALKSRPIMKFDPPPAAPPPEHPTPRSSNEVAAHAVRVASSPGSIDPRQMHN
jgi:hypothetical protein